MDTPLFNNSVPTAPAPNPPAPSAEDSSPAVLCDDVLPDTAWATDGNKLAAPIANPPTASLAVPRRNPPTSESADRDADAAPRSTAVASPCTASATASAGCASTTASAGGASAGVSAGGATTGAGSLGTSLSNPTFFIKPIASPNRALSPCPSNAPKTFISG